MDSSTRFTTSAPLRHDTNKRLSFRSPDILAIYTNRNQPMVRPGSVVGDRLANTDCSCSCRSLPCRGGDTTMPSQVPDAWPPPIIRPPNLKEHKLLHQTVRVLLVPHGSTQGDGLIGIQVRHHRLASMFPYKLTVPLFVFLLRIRILDIGFSTKRVWLRRMLLWRL